MLFSVRNVVSQYKHATILRKKGIKLYINSVYNYIFQNHMLIVCALGPLIMKFVQMTSTLSIHMHAHHQAKVKLIFLLIFVLKIFKI